MSKPEEPRPAMAVLSIFSGLWENFWPELLGDLEDFFGPSRLVSSALAFDHTAYYEPEFGEPLCRRLLTFERLVGQDSLVAAKLFTNELEINWSRPDGRRIFNLDPGILTPERLILATGKNFTHRVYLGQGIFADLTLIYQKGRFQVLPWTFPDYASQDLQELLYAARTELLNLLANKPAARDQG